MSDMEWRSTGAVTAGTGRTIEVMVAPYGDTAPVGPGERYAPGVFGQPRSVALKLETGHGHAGPVVGRATEFRDTDDGLVGVFTISETRDGDDALTLARDGAIGASAGFIPGTRTRSDDGAVIVEDGDLREVTLTGTPAYLAAQVMDVRSHERNVDPMEETPTPSPDGAPNITAVVDDAVTRALDAYRAEVADATAPAPTEVVGHRGHEYRSIVEVLADVNAHARRSDPSASDRLTALIDEGTVSADGSMVAVRTGFPNPPGNSVGDSAPNNVWVPELVELLREGRPTANLFVSRPLPAEGNTLQTPKVTVGNTVDYQDGEGTVVSNTVQQWIIEDWPKSTFAGGQGITIQAMRWSNPSYMDAVIRDLVAGYSERLDLATIAGDPATDTPATNTGFTGILNAGATDIPVGGAPAAAIPLIGSAWAAVYEGSRRAPIAMVMSAAMWGALLNEVDTDGRPLITNEAPMNPAGFGDAGSLGGTLRGVPVVVDENTPDDVIIAGSFRDAYLYEDSGTPATLTLTYPSALVTDVSVHGFASLAIRRPESFAVLSGITIP